MHAAKASANLGLKAHATFSGALAWPYVYPWPQRPAGLVEAAFDELAKRWRPILDAFDMPDVISVTRSIPAKTFTTASPSRCSSNGSEIIRAAISCSTRATSCCSSSITWPTSISITSASRCFTSRTPSSIPAGGSGVYGGFQPWIDRAGRFRSLGDGQVDFRSIFSKLTQYGFDGWAVLEWECCIKSPEQGAAEGAPFISAISSRRRAAPSTTSPRPG